MSGEDSVAKLMIWGKHKVFSNKVFISNQNKYLRHFSEVANFEGYSDYILTFRKYFACLFHEYYDLFMALLSINPWETFFYLSSISYIAEINY